MNEVSAFAVYRAKLQKKKQKTNKLKNVPNIKKKSIRSKPQTINPLGLEDGVIQNKKIKNNSKSSKARKHKSIKKEGKIREKCDKQFINTDQPPKLIPIIIDNVSNQTVQEEHDDDLIVNEINPVKESMATFKFLISPYTPEIFLKQYWEKECMYIKRNNPKYFKNILSTQELDEIFRSNPLHYTRNVDVVSYDNGIKEVHNPEGRAIPAVLWDFYLNGCSIRVLNPQTYSSKVHLTISNLQEYFGTMVGANVYLTPPNSQGFAPHFDDIEAFILQLEGKKIWKLYHPHKKDILARESSGNFSSKDLGDPFMEVMLCAGDTLYFPRGTIHEGRTDGEHSLHITISVYQHTAYADLLEHILPQALKLASEDNVDFRRGLPINYLKHTGYCNRLQKSSIKSEINNRVRDLICKLTEYIDVDSAVDKLGKKFMHDSMPPLLEKQEARCSSLRDADFMKNGKVYNRVEFSLDTNIRLLRYHCLRVVNEDNSLKVYYNTDNAKVYHGEEEQWLELEHSHVPIIERLQNIYPAFIAIEDLPGSESEKLTLAADLWERGLIVTDRPLEVID